MRLLLELTQEEWDAVLAATPEQLSKLSEFGQHIAEATGVSTETTIGSHLKRISQLFEPKGWKRDPLLQEVIGVCNAFNFKPVNPHILGDVEVEDCHELGSEGCCVVSLHYHFGHHAADLGTLRKAVAKINSERARTCAHCGAR